MPLEDYLFFVYSNLIAYRKLGGNNIMGELLTMVVLWAVVIGLMWFLLMRPQKKEQKRVQAMLASMEVGDTALTTSGFYGVIIDITDDDVIVEFGNNKNCRIPMQKAAIAQIEKPNAE
jgi:preprotein translocase subunit YajC